MDRRTMLKSGPAWLAPGYANASEEKAPEGRVHIPAGDFVMGLSNAESRGSGSRNDNRHTVRLSEFHIGNYLVTNAEYKLFCDEAGSRYWPGGNRRESGASHWDNPQFNWKDKAHHPVVFVGYDHAMSYCKWDF